MQPHDTTPTKVCTKCGESKPATTEYFHQHKSCTGGLCSYCRACDAESKRVHYAANKERITAQQRVWREANREKLAERNRAYRVANKERITANDRARYESRKGYRAEYLRAYREANKERIAEHNRVYRVANAERLRASDRARHWARREENIERSRAWRNANKERAQKAIHAWRLANKERKDETDRASVERRRARIRAAEGTFTVADVRAQYARQKGRCFWCGRKVGDTYHIDHVIPLSRGGANDPSNLVIACPPCNLSKGNKLPHEWPEGGRLL